MIVCPVLFVPIVGNVPVIDPEVMMLTVPVDEGEGKFTTQPLPKFVVPVTAMTPNDEPVADTLIADVLPLNVSPFCSVSVPGVVLLVPPRITAEFVADIVTNPPITPVPPSIPVALIGPVPVVPVMLQ